jgi:cell fate (sporulation/competence/biofilm development) regulator YlbF (YheA/YmcA/DUF963 family)
LRILKGRDDMPGVMDRARELGQGLGRTDEYQALRRAISAADDDRELVEARNQLLEIEQKIAQQVSGGEDPGSDIAAEYENAVSGLQVLAGYQRLVVAQANFDKIMARVNEAITGGMDEVGTSRIVIPS